MECCRVTKERWRFASEFDEWGTFMAIELSCVMVCRITSYDERVGRFSILWE